MLTRKDRNYIQLQTGLEGNFQKLELVKDILKKLSVFVQFAAKSLN